jgi:tetratricopeptide (TPR) repeat protein
VVVPTLAALERADQWLLVAVAAFALGLYATAVRNDLVLDAPALIVENPLIQELSRIPILFRSDYWAPRVESGLYRPLATTSFALTWAAAGADPRAHHAADVLLHAANAALAFLLLLRLCGDRVVACAGALLFAAHPVNSEAVANVAGRSDLLVTLFFLLSLLTYTRADPAASGRPRAAYALSLTAFALALLSKESAITLPGVLVLYDFVYAPERETRPLARLRRLARRRFAPRWAGYLLLALAYLGVRQLLGIGTPASGTTRLDNPLLYLDAPWGLVSALKVAFLYLGLLLFPLHLAYDRSFDQIALVTSLRDPAFAGVVVLCALSLAGVVFVWRRSKPAFFAVGFAALTFSVVSNLVVGIGTIMAERLLYLPSVGFCLTAVLGLRRLAQPPRLPVAQGRVAFVALMGIVLALLGLRTLDRTSDWRSIQALFLGDLERSPRSARVQANAAAALIELERKDDAIARLETAIAIEPDFHRARARLADLLLAQGREDEALPHYERVIAVGYSDPAVWNNLGYLLLERGTDAQRGLQLIEVAVELDPHNAHHLDSLGWAYYKLGRLEDARRRVSEALEIDGTLANARRHLEEIERAMGMLPPTASPEDPS